jgi:hypothetical protein
MRQSTQTSGAGAGLMGGIWRHRLWWMLPLGVLFLMLVAIYALEHLSKTDSEMYPTSSQTIVACRAQLV